MSKQIIIAEQHRIAAVFSEEQIQELIVAKGSHQVSDIYYGIVENVLPGIDAAFVNIGDSERNGFIHVSDLGPLRLKRSAGAITDLLAPQQKVLVQVMKEPTGNKGPRLTGNISLPGRYLVLMPYGRGVNLSRRIRNENERNRLRALAVLIKPAGMGLVVRTEAEGMAEEAIMEDLETLLRQWETILQEASTTRAPALLNRDDDFIQRVLRDTYSADVNRIVVDSQTGVKRVKQQLMNWSGGRPLQGVLVDHHKESVPILEYFRVNAAIREALKPRVDLPSGGYIIIERTEALTVVDVNSGSFTRSSTSRETVLWTNYEAATEIARQLRLRNIAGVIIVDFIDMDSRRDQLQLLEHFNKALRADKARPQIAQLTELGLVELTRKRQGQNVYELFGKSCPTCGGIGHLTILPGQEFPLEDDYPMPVEAFDSGYERPFDSRSTVGEPPREAPVRSRTRLSSSTRDRDSRSPRSTSPFSVKDMTWSGRGEGSPDLDSDTLEPDFLHHPSYQERGGSNSRRRRRRRPVGSEARGAAVEGREYFKQEEGTSWEEPDLDESGETEVLSTAEDLAIASTKKSRPERHRASKRGVNGAIEPKPFNGGKPPAPPREIVTVEMTPEEQEVYAWMGVSPLILANREVKNPRSVLVAVTMPGQPPDLSMFSEAEQLTAAESRLELPTLSPSEDEFALNSAAASEFEITPDEAAVEVEPAVTLDRSQASLREEEPVIPTEDSPNRRRRRRSSAAVTDPAGAPEES